MKKQMSILLSISVLTLAVVAQPLPEYKMESYRGPSFCGYAPNKIVITFSKEVIQKFNSEALKQGRTGVVEIDKVGERFKTNLIRRQFLAYTPRNFGGRPVDLSLCYKIYFAEEIDVEQVLQAYHGLNGVVDVQPIGLHYVTATPNDPQMNQQWHLTQSNDHDVDVPEAWDWETGDPNIIVAIIDTGVRYYHKDLGGMDAAYNNFTYVDGNMWINTLEKNGTAGVDDDANGFVDDWIGYDFVDGVLLKLLPAGEDGNVPDNDPRDFNGHGTHCAGNVATLNNNSYGLCSVTGGWGDGTFQRSGNGVKVMALRNGYQIRSGGGIVQMDAAAECFVYAAENGARIASCSWGSSETGNMDAAVDQFLAAGGLIFHAAGNGDPLTGIGLDDPDYLDLRGDCISVAATDQNDNAATFSNFGDWVDISAPGVGIVSLVQNPSDDANDYLASMDGTSMSTPIAASVAALIWSQHPDWNAAQVRQQLFDSADNIESILAPDRQGKMGAGRVNAHHAVWNPIAVTLSSFAAHVTDHGTVAVEWSTETEVQTAGFYVQRSCQKEDDFARIHRHIIVAQGNATEGAAYQFFDRVAPQGECYYRLEEVTLDGLSTFYEPTLVSTLSFVEKSASSPLTFALRQNYPNPFNPVTRISYQIPNSSVVTVKIYDLSGQLVKQLVDEQQLAGDYVVLWDGTDWDGRSVVSGTYLYRLQAGDNTEIRKMVLIR